MISLCKNKRPFLVALMDISGGAIDMFIMVIVLLCSELFLGFPGKAKEFLK